MNLKKTLDEIILKTQHDENIIDLFLYGSHVYGTNNENSDIDLIAIVKSKEKVNYLYHYGDINSYDIEEFKQLINQHEITALECLFLDKDKILKKTNEYEFNLDKQCLRSAISAKASNSWVKSKKKLTVEKDYNEYIGKKSAWHALRILDFGYQIGSNGKIKDYSAMNHLLPEIMSNSSWQDIDTNFRNIYNMMSSRFKAVAPKEPAHINKLKP